MREDCLTQDVQSHSLEAVIHGKICDQNTFTFAIECHSQPVDHGTICDKTLFHKMFNLTHIMLKVILWRVWWDCLFQDVHCLLLPIGHGKDGMRLHFTKCAMSLTSCWSWKERQWDCFSYIVQCHSHPVDNRKVRYGESAFHKLGTHLLLVAGKDEMRWECLS